MTGGVISQIGVSFYGMDVFESYRLPFYFTGILSFFCVALVAFGAKNFIHVEEKHKNNAQSVEIPPDHKRMLNVLYINTFMLGMGMGLAASIAALYANSVLGLSAFYIAVIFTVASGTGIAVSYPVARVADRHGKKGIIVKASLIKCAFMVMIPFAPDSVTYGSCMVARNAGMQAADPPMRGLQADLIPVKLRGKLVGWMNAFNNLGAVVGPIIGGLIYDMSGSSELHFLFFTMFMKGMPFLIAGVLSFMAVALLIIYIDEGKIKK
jgi:MFS family permease